MASGTLVRKVIMQIAADDGDAEAKLDAISRKADELKAKNPELAVRIDTAAASAKVAVLRDELKEVAKPVDIPIEPKVDKAKAAASGKDAGQSFGGGFSGGLSNPYVIGGAVAAALAALPGVAAAGGAMAGIALGAGLLVGTKQVQGPLYAQFHSMTAGIMSVLRTAALPLVKPLGDAFAQIGRWAKQLYPVLHAVFGALGPLVAPLTRGLEGLVSGVLPGFLRLMQAARPAVQTVAGALTQLGKGLGGMFAQLIPGVKSSSQFLGGLMSMIAQDLPQVGRLANIFAQVLGPAVETLATKVFPPLLVQVNKVYNAAAPLLPQIGKLGGILVGAAVNAMPLINQLSNLAVKVLPMLIPPLEKVIGWLTTLANAAIKVLGLLSHIPGLGGLAPSAGTSSAMSAFGSFAASALSPSSGYSAAESAAAADYGSLWAGGATSAPTAASTAAANAAQKQAGELAQLGLQLTGAFANSLANSKSAGAVTAGVNKLLADVKAAWTAGIIPLSKDESLTRWLDAQSAQLQTLATERAGIAGKINAAKSFAASTANSVYGNYDLSSVGGSGSSTVGIPQLKSNLSQDLTQIRQFSANIQKLSKMGLNKGYISQLVSMGPVNGGELANELASSGVGDIKSINAAEYAISEASGQMGQTAANAMYDSGAQAGKGFLSGLEAQEGAINAVMQKIAKNMVSTLRSELGIHSPSTVGHDIGANFGGAVGTGVEAQIAKATQSSKRLSQALAQGAVSAPGAAGSAGASAQQPKITIQLVGGDKDFRTWLKKQIRVTGGNVQVIGA